MSLVSVLPPYPGAVDYSALYKKYLGVVSDGIARGVPISGGVAGSGVHQYLGLGQDDRVAEYCASLLGSFGKTGWIDVSFVSEVERKVAGEQREDSACSGGSRISFSPRGVDVLPGVESGTSPSCEPRSVRMGDELRTVGGVVGKNHKKNVASRNRRKQKKELLSDTDRELRETYAARKIAENKLALLRAQQSIGSWDSSEEFVARKKKLALDKVCVAESRVSVQKAKLMTEDWRKPVHGTADVPPSAVNSTASVTSTEVSSSSSASQRNVCSARVKADVMNVLTCSDLSVRAKGSDLSVVVTKQGKRTKSTGVSIARDYIRLPAWIKNRYEPEVISAASPVDKLLIQLKAITEQRPVTPEPLDSDCYFE